MKRPINYDSMPKHPLSKIDHSTSSPLSIEQEVTPSADNDYTRRQKNPTQFIESELLDFGGNPACLIPSGFFDEGLELGDAEQTSNSKGSPRSILIVETWDGRRVLSLLDK